MRKRRKIVMIVLIFITIIITSMFVYMNFPLFYERDSPESFRFLSDDLSISNDIKYDLCELDSIIKSTEKNVDFYFGCASSQIFPEQNNSCKKDCFAIMISGACGKIIDFSNEEFLNGKPDYYIEFPFNIKNINRSCKYYVYSDGSTEEKELTETPIFHIEEENNFFIEWAEKPGIKDLRFQGINAVKRISYDTYSINYYMSQYIGGVPYYSLNNPKRFNVKLEIPKKYDLLNQDDIIFSDNVHSEQEKNEIWIIQSDLIKDNHFHVIFSDPTKYMHKTIINWVFGLLIAIWIGFLTDFLTQENPFDKTYKSKTPNNVNITR